MSLSSISEKNRLLCSWSGGKDSCYALMKMLQKGFSLAHLLNVTNENGDRSRSHGLSPDMIRAQAKALGAPIHFVSSSWEDYEQRFISSLVHLKNTAAVSDIVYGDIDIESHKQWEEKVAQAATLKPHLPLWQNDREQLVHDMIGDGIEAIIVSCNETMGKEYLGQPITKELIPKLKAIGIDPCGENGEYHTLVVNCPIFSQRIKPKTGDIHVVGNYHFLDLSL